jgi:hypothetical protein
MIVLTSVGQNNMQSCFVRSPAYIIKSRLELELRNQVDQLACVHASDFGPLESRQPSPRNIELN